MAELTEILMRFCRSLALIFLLSSAAEAAPVDWQKNWNDGLFARASAEGRFVLLDLHAVWCHWCHVMDETTYQDPEVQRLIAKHYVAVSVDADSDPELTARYGNWGWPATIVLAPDGTEIVKRRGYIAPTNMASLLQAIVDDPSPGPSIVPTLPLAAPGASRISASARTALLKAYNDFYDSENGGWGRIHKFVDTAAMDYAFVQTDGIQQDAPSPQSNSGQREAISRVQQTLLANLALQDPVFGGVYQYSDELDWRSPHYEKLLAFQADNLRLYSEAYARWGDSRYLQAAQTLFGYIDRFLTAPDGGFYASQDADLSREIDGKRYYSLDAAGRAKLGFPRIDVHRYAREAGWAIRALAKYADVANDDRALRSAERSARWILANRSVSGGGFKHDAQDRGGPFLDDNVSMAHAFLALYRSTGEREWLRHAVNALQFIDRTLRHTDMGFIAAMQGDVARGVFKEPIRPVDVNVTLARVANLAYRYTGEERYRAMGEYAMKFLVAYSESDPEQLLPAVLLAEHELAFAPVHITIVGAKDDTAAQALQAAARRFPAEYLQIDWLDAKEGPLPNPEIQYPALKRAAAFACADGACSSPVFEPERVATAARNAMAQ